GGRGGGGVGGGGGGGELVAPAALEAALRADRLAVAVELEDRRRLARGESERRDPDARAARVAAEDVALEALVDARHAGLDRVPVVGRPPARALLLLAADAHHL